MKPTYSNDRTAPRMRKAKFSKMVITRELYDRFCKEYPEYKLTWAQFYQYWQDIAAKIRYHTVYNPLGLKLGSYTGELKFQYLPHKFKANDRSTSALLGEKVDFINLAMKGKVGKVKWERRWAVKRNKILQFYAFDGTRELIKVAKHYIVANPDKLRIARNTLGGHSVWRQKRIK